MIIVQAEALVLHTCYLSEEDSESVKAQARDLAARYHGDEEEYYEQAVEELYNEGVIDLYGDSTESDFSTERIARAYEEREKDDDDEDDNEEGGDD